ncbi:sensor histidine kinase [Ancylomarina longa]|uniref:GHKL domain-containing protein n=1 Tax=Ancylomarina longa TaxID=2487017 RepID=A0A434AZ22_9BACT|nr:histidine kinase [Ancylomarina longa]RUT79871.1 GHKL domain-containing protein [Ancylomarina longa]
MNFKEKLYNFFTIRWVQHLSFWSVFLLLELGRFIDMDPKRFANELFFEGIQIGAVILLVYFNLRVLIPKYWNTGNYLKYIFQIIKWEAITISILSIILYNFPEIEFRKFAMQSPWKMVIMNSFRTNIFILSSSLFHFVKEWIKLKDENLKFTEKAQEQLEAELNVLKAQVNPHFLFNTLNNIYSMSLYDSAKTPDMILKLSQLISYMLYECKDEEVSLEKEIQFIKNYIELESVRVEDVAQINLQIDGENQEYQIPPLLFIPLIENAFKHGINSVHDSSEINIQISISDSSINLDIENPYEQMKEVEAATNHKGLGIQNVKKRLELLYPKRHIFTTSIDNNLYKTHLSLSL